ncbi:MAG: FlgD immunoglobulin-like domain containing protein, partial [Candidatus Eisenbacteria bacterium]
LDPLFCGEFNPLRPYLLGGASPCAAENNPGCGQSGAWPVGCDAPQSRAADWEASARTMLGTAPNPFVRATLMRFDIPAALAGEQLTLRMLDAAGRLVRVLRAGPAEPGYHSVAWDGRDLLGRSVPGGLYFGELRVGGERTTQRVIVVR